LIIKLHSTKRSIYDKTDKALVGLFHGFSFFNTAQFLFILSFLGLVGVYIWLSQFSSDTSSSESSTNDENKSEETKSAKQIDKESDKNNLNKTSNNQLVIQETPAKSKQKIQFIEQNPNTTKRPTNNNSNNNQINNFDPDFDPSCDRVIKKDKKQTNADSVSQEGNFEHLKFNRNVISPTNISQTDQDSINNIDENIDSAINSIVNDIQGKLSSQFFSFLNDFIFF
jgi:hypothetical protein